MDENNKTLFNSAQKTLDRLNERFYECNQASDECVVHGLSVPWLIKWHNILKTINREINCKYKKNEEQQSRKLFLDYLKITPLIVYVNTEHKGKIPLINKKVFYKKMEQLDNIEIFLRNIADQRGMLNPTGTDVLGGLE